MNLLAQSTNLLNQIAALGACFVLGILPSQSQDDGCGTPNIDSLTAVDMPYFANNQYLLDLVAETEGSGPTPLRIATTTGGVIATAYQIPVKAWIHDGTGAGETGIPNELVEVYISYVNDFYQANDVQIFLYVDCNDIVRVTDKFYDGVKDDNYNVMFDDNWSEHHFNLHFVNGNDGFNRGRFPWKNKPYASYVTTYGDFSESTANSFTHEIGHSFGLLHTHENSGLGKDNARADGCEQEWVDPNARLGTVCSLSLKKRCEVNGDMLCDTNADPQIKKGEITVNESDCTPNFIGSDNDYKKDNSGVQWFSGGRTNALRNIMSYSRKSCRTTITPMQRGLMYHYVKKHGGPIDEHPNESRFKVNAGIDIFENDNLWKTEFFTTRNTRLNLNEIQYHTFHKGSNNASSCDVDWMYLEAFSPSTYSIYTQAVSGQSQPDTEIFLYAVNADGTLGSLLASNRNESGSSTFSRITRSLNPGDYALRVINHSPNVVGHYQVVFSDQCFDFENNSFAIAGTTPLCTSNRIYTAQNVIPGVTVNWSATPTSLFAVTSGSGTTFTTRAINSTVRGSGLITALYTSASCGTKTVTYPVYVGKPSFSGYMENGQYLGYGSTINNVCNLITQRTVITTYGSASVVWQKVTSNPSNISWNQVGNNLSFYFYSVGQTATFRMTMTNSCGSQYYDFSFKSVSCGGGGCTTFALSPNPASQSVGIIVPNIPAPCGSASLASEDVVQSEESESTSIQSIQILSFDGQSRMKREFSGKIKETSLDISGLDPGVYLVRIVAEDKHIETHRLIVE